MPTLRFTRPSSRSLVFIVALAAGMAGCKACSKGSGATVDAASSSSRASPLSPPGDPLSAVRWDGTPIDWTRPLPTTPPGGVAQAGYVGAEACKECHGALYRSYERHSMARTGLRPLASLDQHWLAQMFDAGESHPVRHAASGFSYRPFRKGNQYFVEEMIQTDDGAKIHSWVQRITHALSAGSYGLAFYFQAGERIYHVPVDYYPTAGVWGLDPTASRGNPRFSAPLETFCISCHSDYPRMQAGTNDVFVGGVPTGVGCERCHGPGERHAASGRPEDIVNPAHLSSARQIDVCSQCHESSFSQLREGRHDFSYRPGEPLDAYRVNYLEDPAESDRFKLLAHSERMVQSACFRESGGILLCTSCHDAHKSTFEQAADYWDKKCDACHHDKPCTEQPAVRAARQDHCVGCHMRVGAPTSPTLVSVTDHWIQRRPPPIAPGDTTPQRLVAWSSHLGESDSGGDLGALEADAYGEAGKTDDAARRAFAALDGFPHVPRFYERLLWRIDRASQPRALATVLRFAPDEGNALTEYARMMLDQGSPASIAEAGHALDRELAIDPDNARALEARAEYSFRSGSVEEAKPLFARATASPIAGASHVALALLALRDGGSADAIRELEAARQIEPSDAWIAEKLASLYSSSHDEEHGREIAKARAYFVARGGPTTTTATRWLPPTWR